MTAMLRVPELDLYAIFDRMSDGVIVISPDGKTVYRNPAMATLPGYLEQRVLDYRGPNKCCCVQEQCSDPVEYTFLEGWTLSCHTIGTDTAYIFKLNDQLQSRIVQLREEFSQHMANGVLPETAALRVLRSCVNTRWVSIGATDLVKRRATFNIAYDGDKIVKGIVPDITPVKEFDFCEAVVTTDAIGRCFEEHHRAHAIGINYIVGVSLLNLRQECVGLALLADDHEPDNLYELVTLLQELRVLFAPFYEANNAYCEARAALEEAHTDALTGKGNRRACEAFLQECLDDLAFETQDSDILAMLDPNSMRNAIIMLIDFDGFKRINDQMGHEEGDRLLRLVSDELAALDSNSKVFRLGGDEFVQVFPRAGSLEAEDLRQKINLIELKMRKVGFESIGLSMGVVHFFEGDGTIPSLFTLADARMYHDKHLRQVSFL